MGSGIVAVDGQAIAPGGVANWLNPGQVIFQHAADDRLYLYDVHSGRAPTRLEPPNLGANTLAAGGGRWIAWLAGTGLYGPSGVIDPHGRLAGTSMEQDGRGASSPDGHIAVTDSENEGFRILSPSGETTQEVTGTYALSMQVLSATEAVWVDETNRPRAVGLEPPAIPSDRIYAIRAVTAGGRRYILAGTENGLILYPWADASKGWRLIGLAFYPAAFVRGTDVEIAYAAGAGETPGSLRSWRVDVARDPMVSLDAAPPAPTPQPDPQQPEPEPEPEPMPEIPNQSATVARVREKYPTPLGASHAACLLEIAREIGQGAGLLRKDTGTNILLPDGTRVAQDIIVFTNGDGYDCLGSGETLATPQWGGPVEGSPFPASRYYKVSAASPAPEPQPEPEPGPGPDPGQPEPPPSGDTQALILAELRKMNAVLGRVFR